MGTYDHHKDAYHEVVGAGHKAKLSHELIAAAAAYEAAKVYNEHVAKNGSPPSHAQAKQIMAAAAGFFIDRMVETKGLDFIDRQKAKRQAEDHVHATFTEDVYANHDYEGFEGYEHHDHHRRRERSRERHEDRERYERHDSCERHEHHERRRHHCCHRRD